MTWVAKAYLDSEGVIFKFLIIWYQWAVRILKVSGWLSGTLAAGTLGSSGVSLEGFICVLVGVDVRELATISLQDSDTPELLVPNRKGKRQVWGFYRLVQIIDWTAVSVSGGKNWYGAVVWEEFDCFCHSLRAIFGDIHSVLLV